MIVSLKEMRAFENNKIYSAVSSLNDTQSFDSAVSIPPISFDSAMSITSLSFDSLVSVTPLSHGARSYAKINFY